jgi:hypothetical protein
LARRWLGQAAVRAFLDDFTISFDHHQAERDLRLCKVQQKVSGCFCAASGTHVSCRIRGY